MVVALWFVGWAREEVSSLIDSLRNTNYQGMPNSLDTSVLESENLGDK